ncbi:uncharacterized protein FOMMEDRAFT_160023 [Fomitiporia mediterranea MF3/22]|uniref:uncharacterized protein n=1 Tax=Fomitiporia mediterranea (strain MF3/22) TaxID=694068 RepID=UPI0004409627|nr:uncharacterized protein FOMMEDRAFT_160023 [Fomitiporia mediterranea MF3/22]EJC99601.1 hypothetical protein FOMMEDRAFT_160023 [Fomitiporia mediterranea MF3/22]
MEISEVYITYGPSKQVKQQVRKLPKCNATEQISLEFAEKIPVGSADLTMKYSAQISETLNGYCYDTWEDDNGVEHSYAFTHFQPHKARKAFPCWDEIHRKATFNITMISHHKTVNLSNMIESGDDTYDGDWKITKFETTEKMSTYIVAFANGHFKYAEARSVPHLYKEGDFALKVMNKVLPHYEKMFKLNYPLRKLDTLIVHNMDNQGAMENWGLIIGQATAFCLDDPAAWNTSLGREIALAMCHEVSHMWFGNLVFGGIICISMKGSQLWLAKSSPLRSENANTILSVRWPNAGRRLRGSSVVDSKWIARNTFITDHLEVALTTDAKISSHAIEQYCPDEETAIQRYDALSYQKGAAVLLMLHDYVGDSIFFEGVKKYLKDHCYSNAKSDDLWNAINIIWKKSEDGKETKTTISELMKNWVIKTGFPYIEVIEDSRNPKYVGLRQRRFLAGKAISESIDNTIWQIPLKIRIIASSNAKEPVSLRTVVTDEAATIKLDTNKQYILSSGFYRVHYNSDRLEKIASDSGITTAERIKLLNDAFALAAAGISNIKNTSALFGSATNGPADDLWKCIDSKLSSLIGICSHGVIMRKMLEEFFQSLYPSFESWTRKDFASSLLKSTLICGAASFNEPIAIKKLQDIFAERERHRIPKDIEAAVYKTVVKHGEDTGLISRTLWMVFGTTSRAEVKNEIQNRDVFWFIDGLARNPVARQIVAKRFMERFAEIYEDFKGTEALPWLAAFRQFSERKDVESIKAWERSLSPQVLSSFRSALKLTTDTIHDRAKQYENIRDDVRSFCERNSASEVPSVTQSAHQTTRTEGKKRASTSSSHVPKATRTSMKRAPVAGTGRHTDKRHSHHSKRESDAQSQTVTRDR